MTDEIPSTATLSTEVANLISTLRRLTTALSASDLDERDEILAWATAANELLTNLTDHVIALEQNQQ